MYTWHFTFDAHPAVRDLAARYQARLAGLPGLDVVPVRWLHLTTQGVGFTDEVSDSDVEAIIGTARQRLAGLSPAEVTLGPARVTDEAILLDVTHAGGLRAVREGLRAAISDVWSPDRVPDAAEWTPHVSVAYSSTTSPAGPYAAALADCADSAQCLIGAVQLIVLGRDEHVYEWTTRADIELSLSAAAPADALRADAGS
jgi:2'-5' RNA ligase superfamily protein